MLVWYWKEDEQILNFGEHIVPEILNYFDVPYKKYSERDRTDNSMMLIVGSELNDQRLSEWQNEGIAKFYVWGMGYAHGVIIQDTTNIDFLMVRGKLTKNLYNAKCDIIADAGFCLPEILPLKREPSERIIFAPHHSNRFDIEEKMKLLNATDFFDVMFERGLFKEKLQYLIDSKFVFTNSLHIAIACLCYDVPFCVSILPYSTFNFPLKWYDIFETNIQYCSNIEDGMRWHSDFITRFKKPDAKEIIKTFPKHLFL